MADDITVALIAATPGLLACAGGMWLWFTKFSDAKQIEEMTSKIRHDVEERLKTHEARLRIEADVQLRMHDRSWQILREFMAAAFDAHRCILDFATTVATGSRLGMNGPYERPDRARDAADASLVKLQSIAAISPPELDASDMTTPFKEAFRDVLEMLKEQDQVARGEQLVSVRKTLDAGIGDVGRGAKTWNETLWRTSTDVPLLAKEGSTAIEKK